MLTKLQVLKNSFKLFQKEFFAFNVLAFENFLFRGLEAYVYKYIFLVMGIQSGTKCCIYACR